VPTGEAAHAPKELRNPNPGEWPEPTQPLPAGFGLGGEPETECPAGLKPQELKKSRSVSAHPAGCGAACPGPAPLSRPAPLPGGCHSSERQT